MSFDYFYGQQSDLFTFYRVPKVLFTNERFWNISADAKMLYGILLDRMSLSAKNGWIRSFLKRAMKSSFREPTIKRDFCGLYIHR